jgi:hypothetical protein
MKKIWPWIVGICVGLLIIGLLFAASSDKHDYWVARGTTPKAIQITRAEDITLVRFPCGMRTGSIQTVNECGFYVWKK